MSRAAARRGSFLSVLAGSRCFSADAGGTLRRATVLALTLTAAALSALSLLSLLGVGSSFLPQTEWGSAQPKP